jgi:hypothetical protein
MKDEHLIIAEVYQARLALPTHIINPCTPGAERMAMMINENLPARLCHMPLE